MYIYVHRRMSNTNNTGRMRACHIKHLVFSKFIGLLDIQFTSIAKHQLVLTGNTFTTDGAFTHRQMRLDNTTDIVLSSLNVLLQAIRKAHKLTVVSILSIAQGIRLAGARGNTTRLFTLQLPTHYKRIKPSQILANVMKRSHRVLVVSVESWSGFTSICRRR